jgi:hypothetical protein
MMFVTVIAEEDEIEVLNVCNCKSKAVFPNIFCSRTPFGFQKITTDPYILAHAHDIFNCNWVDTRWQ